MYAGHFATALMIKATRPRASTAALLVGTGLLDLAFGVLVIAGVEGAAPDYDRSHRLVIPWSHSLLGAVLLAALFAAVMRSRTAGWSAAFVAVLSHWLLDVAVHRADMPIWPWGGPALGLFRWMGPVSGWFETLVVVLALALYAIRARRSAAFGRNWSLACATVCGLWALGLAA